ncbi:MAG: nucleoside deaminase [Bacteroidales bacterium]|nr:nucleoside deaminase [Bacteroidales bacterium]
MNVDRSLLQRALRLAEKGISEGHGPFGAVIALGGKIVGEASNSVVKSGDPTAHAEILAIREAASILRTHDLSSCVLYSSCEPCPMCLGAIYWSGIRKVVYAADRHDAEKSGFSDKLIYDELALDPGARKIEFVRLPDAGGEEVFRKWDEFENKVPY